MKYAENVSLSLLPKATRARSAAAEAADVAVGRRSSSIAVLFTTFVPLFRLLFSRIRSEIRERLRVFQGRVSVALFGALPSSVSFLTLEYEGRSERGRPTLDCKCGHLICFRAIRVRLKPML